MARSLAAARRDRQHDSKTLRGAAHVTTKYLLKGHIDGYARRFVGPRQLHNCGSLAHLGGQLSADTPPLLSPSPLSIRPSPSPAGALTRT
jgi:hypothetical protein